MSAAFNEWADRKFGPAPNGITQAERFSSYFECWQAALSQAGQAVDSDKWGGAEEWMPLAWQLCANECGEESCAELVWEGGPIPEPWGDRWLKYEDQAKEMIAMVRKHVPSIAGLPTDNQRTNHMSTNTEHTQGNCWYDSTTGVFLVDTTGRIIGDVQVRSDGAYAFHEKKLLGSYYTIGHAKEAVERAVSSSTKPSEDARDAARYRWLRDPANAYSPQWDAIIDAAIVADALDALVDDGIAASLGGGLKGE